MIGMPLTALVRAARAAGISLRDRDPEERHPHLYVWTTPTQEKEVLYIGKAADPRRTTVEEGLNSAFDATQINVGFVVLVKRHQAQRHDLHYDSVDLQKVLEVAAPWNGPALDTLRADIAAQAPWGLPDVEMVLIRMAVLAGYPTGNSSGAGQWEQMMGDRRNTLAAIAVDQDDELSLGKTVEVALDKSKLMHHEPS